ncbi:Unknown protein [Striga hermonthica]|uniref:Uncharacterized protein n=1 Tax=Striga hermonthica TaxID=68872 RepID=A0A9N7NAH1_STRHE|nr:Unknown protein [Striga hermonthica]
MLNQAAKDSSNAASARIGVREHLNQSNVSSNVPSAGVEVKLPSLRENVVKQWGKGLMKAFDASGKKLKIDVDPLTGRPKNREQSAKLSSQIGVVARDVLRVPRKWKEMDEEKLLEPCIDLIKIHMDVNLDASGARHCLVDRMKSSSRQVRYRLHKHYKKYATLQEAKNNKPPFCVSKENWDELCDYFASAKFKAQKNANGDANGELMEMLVT